MNFAKQLEYTDQQIGKANKHNIKGINVADPLRHFGYFDELAAACM